MKKSTFKRMGLGVIQHLLAAGIMVAVAWLLLNSYIAVDSIDGTQVYKIFSMGSKQEFEESEIYHDLFRNAFSDITQLVMIKRQVETDGVLDPAKKIDVTAYAGEIGEDQGCSVTAVYDLDDIIKWGKNDVEYNDRTMSMSEFVNYFGYCIYPENFMVDEYGQLAFDDFYRVRARDADDQAEESDGEAEINTSTKSGEEIAALEKMMKDYSEEQLEDLVFYHIMSEKLNGVYTSREDDASLNVTIRMMICRYPTVDGERQLINLAGNWVDYTRLQDNVEATIRNLMLNYQRYQVCNDAYKENATNVKYMVRMMTDSGMCTYTNIAEWQDLPEDEVTEKFSEYRRYLIYYPDSLVFMGNTILSEEEIDDYISVYNYAYPDTTHIWLGVDDSYAVEGDTFYKANATYQKIVPKVGRIIALIVFLFLVWTGVGVYMTFTAGAALSENGEQVWYLNRFDRIWTEVFALIAAAFLYGGVFGYRMIMGIAETAGVIPAEVLGIPLTKLYRYGVFAAFGVYVSGSLNLIWYSMARRARANNLWRDSFLHFLCRGLSNSVRFIFRHKNSVVSTLLPYNFFLFANLAGLMAVYKLREQRLYMLIWLAVMVVADGIVGVIMFRHGAEQKEIVEGINRIRDGEVDFKLDAESLHGSSREMADAVNNIGEGIRKAVKTSMKDEQLKTDLITNVSHDIKTPLTSIINYVDLLKRLKIEEEPARGYIEILDGKAQRLKQLTDDLVEASKISSGSIVLNMEKLDLTELIKQGIGEFSEKLEECRLQIVFTENDSSACIYADSRRMWRVIENLFNNICKYALEGTRVYIDMGQGENTVEASIKNISRQQMNIRPEELTERFIRGDSSRSTEGSGLGLSIAKSLVQVQGGTFDIFLDGDLFKITLSFPIYSETEEES